MDIKFISTIENDQTQFPKPSGQVITV